MTKHPRCNILLNSGSGSIAFEHFPKSLSAHRRSGTVKEQQMILFIFQEGIPSLIQIHLKCLSGRSPERNHPLLAVLPADNPAKTKVHILHFQVDQFADSHASGIEKFQHSLVPHSFWIISWRLFQKMLHLFHCQNSRKLFLHFWRFQKKRRILVQYPFPYQIFKKSFHRSNVAGNGSRRHSIFLHMQYISVQRRSTDISCRGNPLFFHIYCHLGQIAMIWHDRITGQLLYLFQISRKKSNFFIHNVTPNYLKMVTV